MTVPFTLVGGNKVSRNLQELLHKVNSRIVALVYKEIFGTSQFLKVRTLSVPFDNWSNRIITLLENH